jgi:hypothetical protein
MLFPAFETRVSAIFIALGRRSKNSLQTAVSRLLADLA